MPFPDYEEFIALLNEHHVRYLIVGAQVPSGQVEEKLDKVTFIFNFFDELRRIAPPSKK